MHYLKGKMNHATLILTFSCLMFLLTSCLGSTCKFPGDSQNLDCDAKIQWDVCEEAELTAFSCELAQYEGKDSLIFTVGIKNISDKPLRYRLNIFLDDLDKGFGALVPRKSKVKGEPAAIEPGQSETVTVPFIKTNERSKKISVFVETMQQ